MRLLKLLVFLCVAAPSLAQASEPVPGYGKISPVPGAANLPDRNLRYRVIFSVTKAADAPAKVNPSLEKVARFLNLLGSQGVELRQTDVVVILHGPATPVVLTDAAYRARYGTPNPNLPLVSALRSAGATVHICGQALVAQNIDRRAVSPDVITDLSAMTTIATLQLKGWVLLPE
jgi:intracellular sulfur oxidation DsrE/DsrF family protein